jgi:ABC-type transport system involved in multi-copper enzyme maturation permease subunit
MELISLFRRSLAARQGRTLLRAAGLAVAGFALLALGQWSGLQHEFKSLPEGWQAFLGQPAGWMGIAGFGWLFPVLMGWTAILLGTEVLAGEEERGALALLLVGSVRPGQLVWVRWLALASLTLLPTAALSLVLLAGGLAGWGDPQGGLAGLMLVLWLFSLCCGSVALLAGCLSGRVRVGLLAGGLTLGLGLLLDRLGQVFSALRFFQYITPYGWYGGPRLESGLWLPGILLLAGASLACALASAAGFSKRDLPV